MVAECSEIGRITQEFPPNVAPPADLEDRTLAAMLQALADLRRPNTVLAVAYDLKVFTTVGKPPRRVRPADVLAFMTAQCTGGQAACRWPVRVRAGCRPGRCAGGCRARRVCMGSCTPVGMRA